ncbi:MAG TPA: class I SAM-dependent methyltransferase [Actinomycetota bacterium]|nr:class I SAM-dependent methyltransferase [Actinomycetota bacterium]
MTLQRRRLAQRYGRIARAYRTYWAPILLAFSEPLLAQVPVRRGARVLDLGAGVGTIAAHVARRSGRGTVTGIDASHDMLAQARGMKRVTADITTMPFTDESFDVLLSTFVLQHVARGRAVFAEAARVLSPGGRIATATWGARAAEAGGPYDVMARALDAAHAPPDPLAAMKTWHERVDAPEKLARMARAAGLDVERAWTETVAYTWTPDTFVGWASSMGFFMRRLELLDETQRARVLVKVARALTKLSPDQMTWRPDVVFFIARR